MKTSLIITTINKFNKNIRNFDYCCKKKNWDFIVIGDNKSPKNFKLKYGSYYNVLSQKKNKTRFSKICPVNNYARKNIGYQIAIKNKSQVIVETDDDNYPKNNFFNNKKLIHKTNEIKNKDWVNVYDLFSKEKNLIWPRGLPLNFIKKNRIRLSKQKVNKFYLQQGVCENNPDVDAIYRLINEKINVKFKNDYYVSLGKSYSPSNSQNTIWFEKIYSLMYLPVTCTMRSTDIIRSLITLRILQNDNKKILFFGTTMFQKRNVHNILKDFELEIPLYLNCEMILNILLKLKLKKGEKYYTDNLVKCYKALIQNKIIKKAEMRYLNAWISDLRKIS